MKKPLRAIYHGLRHEHAPGKLETLAKLRDTFEIVAAVDDLASSTPTWHAAPPAGPAGVLGPQTDRYAGLLLELAAIVRGEKPNPVELYDHDLKVHDTCLRVCGLDL